MFFIGQLCNAQYAMRFIVSVCFETAPERRSNQFPERTATNHVQAFRSKASSILLTCVMTDRSDRL